MLKISLGRLLVPLAVAAIVLLLQPRSANAVDEWTPTLLATTTNTLKDPFVIADQTGAIHVFWGQIRQLPADFSSITELDYSNRVNGTWSQPTDVYAKSTVNAPSAAVDSLGWLHLFWLQSGGILYSGSAPVDRGSSAAGWSTPEPVAQASTSVAVVADSTGALDLVYPGWGSSGVLFRRSVDGGSTWQSPTTVSPAASNSSALYPRVAVSADGIIHVVWTELLLPNGWPPTGLYYSDSRDHGQTWSPPIQMAGPGFNQANVAAGPGGLVHVAWNGAAGVRGRFDRWSTDGGTTWSDAYPLYLTLAGSVDVGGSTGPPGLVVDNSGVVHILFEEGNRVWHSAWLKGEWSKPDYVQSGDESDLPPLSQGIDSKIRHIEQPVMAINQGNELVVVFWDERPGLNRLWAVTRTLSVPASTTEPFAVATATALPSPVTAPRTDVVAKADDGVMSLVPFPVDSRVVAALSLVPVLGLLLGVVGIRYWLHSR